MPPKKHFSRYTLGIVGLLALAACQTTPPPPETTPAVQQQQAPWAGRYLGLIPCSDCKSIDLVLVLDETGHYELSTRRLGNNSKTISTSGTYTRVGNILTLSQADYPRQFQVGENVLLVLDEHGQRYPDAKSEHYLLKKAATLSANPPSAQANTPLSNAQWQLIPSQGLSPKQAKGSRAPFIQFKPENNRFHGFSGCNNFSGQMNLGPGAALKLSQIASTRKMCPNMEYEQKFLAMLAEVDAYTLSSDTLSLQKNKTALAQFKMHPLKPTP